MSRNHARVIHKSSEWKGIFRKRDAKYDSKKMLAGEKEYIDELDSTLNSQLSERIINVNQTEVMTGSNRSRSPSNNYRPCLTQLFDAKMLKFGKNLVRPLSMAENRQN